MATMAMATNIDRPIHFPMAASFPFGADAERVRDAIIHLPFGK
jgi:hypothetical protein